VVLGDAVLARDGYLAGTDEMRLADLERMLDDDRIAAIWFARGGYWTARLLDRLPWRRFKTRPKPLIGYSDLTALFNPYAARTGQICLYGPVVTELGDRAAFHGPSLRAALSGAEVTMRIRARQVLVPGRARGRLFGGNLTVLTHLCGTRFAPDLDGAVLLLEDVGEPTYRIDRMLTHLRQAGVFNGLCGVLLGALSATPRRRFPPDRKLAAIVEEAFAPLGIPVVVDLPVGHRAGKWTVPIGGTARIDTRAGRLRLGR